MPRRNPLATLASRSLIGSTAPELQGARMMPSATRILDSLATIANEATPLAVAWHTVFGVAGLALVAGWRPSRRTAAGLLVLPLVSVGVVVWAFDSPFNGVVFLALALALLGVGVRLGD